MSAAEKLGEETPGLVSRRRFFQGAAAIAAAAPTLSWIGKAEASDDVFSPSAVPIPDVPLYDLEVWQAADRIRRRKISPVDLAVATLERIADVEPLIGAFVNLAASEFMIGMGTRTGGSIRRPAGNVGVTGFKPTYGTISLHGIFPLAWSMDHSGPLVHSARDAALLVDTIGGEDPLDIPAL